MWMAGKKTSVLLNLKLKCFCCICIRLPSKTLACPGFPAVASLR